MIKLRRTLEELIKNSFFSRWKVFYQILTIILVMIFFIGFQGYNSLKIINNMQFKLQQIFSENIGAMGNITNVRNGLKTVQQYYFESMRGLQTLDNTNRKIDQLAEQIQMLSAVDFNLCRSLQTELKKLQRIVENGADDAGYDQLKKSINTMDSQLTYLYNRLLGKGIQSIAGGNSFSRASRANTIISLVLSILIAVLLGIVISSSLSGSLKEMVRAARSLAQGDLSQNISTLGCPEVAQVAQELNLAIAGLRELTQKVNHQAEELFHSSTDLKASAFETGKSANEVAKAMDELAKGSMEQAEQINQAVVTVNRLAELVRKVTEDTERITKASEQVAQSAQLGKKASNDVTRGINELFDFTREVSEMINRLNDASGRISEITAMIGNIAEQTSLLALNASIEAARAGDYGKGFGVVARKTAKLAEESKQAAQDITGLIAQMRNQTESAVEIMQKGIDQAQADKEAVDKAGQTFESIFNALSENLNRIREVAKSASLMGESNESVVNAITTIATISEESSASTEEVSASTQQQTAAIEQVTTLADNLSQIADDLKRSVAVFKLEKASQKS